MNRHFKQYAILLAVLGVISLAGTAQKVNAETVIWNTFLGGGGYEDPTAIALDVNGKAYIVGYTNDTWGSPIRPYTDGDDVFVAKVDGNGNLIWNTFLGGGSNDEATGVAVDGNGNIYVAGFSYDTWGTPIRPFTVGYDAFVAKLDNNGNLIWNTFLGGSNWDFGAGVAVYGNGNIYVAGRSYVSWGSPIRAFTGNQDAFVAKLDNNGNLIWNTFLGGNAVDLGGGIAVAGGSENIYMSGRSEDTWGSPVRAFTADRDAFVAKLNNNGNLIWNTFLGGSADDGGAGIALVENENVFVSGESEATWGSPIRPYTGEGTDIFIAKVDSSGNLGWNTFLGSNGYDRDSSVALDGNGNVYAAAMSPSTWGSPIRPYSGGDDAFVAGLDTNGNLIWNTFLGSSANDGAKGIAVSQNGSVYVLGYSAASWGSPIRPYAESLDAFVARLTRGPQAKIFLPLILRQ